MKLSFYIFHTYKKKYEERVKISSDRNHAIETLFDSFRYLNRLPRYDDSKFSRWLRRENRE